MRSSLSSIAENLPSWEVLLVAGPLSLLWAWGCLHVAGHLRLHGARCGDTRKLFHFLIFFSVAAIHVAWGFPVVCLFGAMTSLVIGYAILRGDGHPLYEAMAREGDAPHRTRYIVMPFVATLAGGLVVNLLAPATAIYGYLVGGVGDAVGEPVGTRFGRHSYTPPSFGGIVSRRTFEGSAAVFVASCLSVALALRLTSGAAPCFSLVSVIVALGLACALVEAVSPHGWDNFTMQAVPSLLALQFP